MPRAVEEPLAIGPITLGVAQVLAPMADVTNAPFRSLCRDAALRAVAERGGEVTSTARHAAGGLFVCEMITARALVDERPSTWRLVAADPGETPRSVQLHGVDPHTMGLAARKLVSRGLAHHIDINFGCPVPKITRKGGGSALPWKTSRYVDIIRRTIAGARAGSHEAGLGFVAPVTVKIRSGIDDDHRIFRDAALAAQDAGVAAVCLHARTTAEYYSGSAHWDDIASLVDVLDVPVLGNGDIGSGEDARDMMAHTGCAAVEVGRGAQGRPWIFYDIAHALAGDPRRWEPTSGQVCDLVREHARRLVSWGGDEEHALRDMRKHMGWYLRGFPVGGEIKRSLSRVSSLAELDELLEAIDPEIAYPVAAKGLHGRKGRTRPPKLPHGWLATRDLDEAAHAVLDRAALEHDLSYESRVN